MPIYWFVRGSYAHCIAIDFSLEDGEVRVSGYQKRGCHGGGYWSFHWVTWELGMLVVGVEILLVMY